MAVGTVYIFNATPNAMNLLLNNNILATNIAGIQQSSGYAPVATTAARNTSSGNPGNNTFGGTNSLVVAFPTGSPQPYTVNIPSTIQITNDVQLYIYFNYCILVDPTGTATIQSPPTASVSASDAEKVGTPSLSST
jgi:hypothetical protein